MCMHVTVQLFMYFCVISQKVEPRVTKFGTHDDLEHPSLGLIWGLKGQGHMAEKCPWA